LYQLFHSLQQEIDSALLVLVPCRVKRVVCDLYGSLSATGKGHGIDSAIALGLLGQKPESVIVDNVATMLEQCAQFRCLSWSSDRSIAFDPKKKHRLQVSQALAIERQFPVGCPLVVFSCHRRYFLKQFAHSQYVAQIIIRRIAFMPHVCFCRSIVSG
jgi:hypothetical protein